MELGAVAATSRVFEVLVKGQKAHRLQVQASLMAPEATLDRHRLRLLIVDALEHDYYPGREDEEENPEVVSARCWLLGSLGRVADDDDRAAKVVRRHLNPKFEPNTWARYWALEALIVAKVADIEAIARQVLKDEAEILVRQLASVALAERGDKEQVKAIQNGLEEQDSQTQWATVRALQIVPLIPTGRRLCEIVENSRYSEVAYDAIRALGRIPARTVHAERAARALTTTVEGIRRYPGLDGMRAQALAALGSLEVTSTGPMLIDQLTDDNPAVVREAARSLERILGVRTAAARVVEVASEADAFRLQSYATALRFMDRAAIVEELELAMTSGPVERQNAARTLLSEIGGAEAMQKLRARTHSLAQYTATLKETEEKIRELFESSIEEARRGFRLATVMDTLVFCAGLILIATSAGLVLVKGETLNAWTTGITGGSGVLGVLYGTLIAKPRRQVREAVDHLMYLKVIFLAYLRQLHQVDQVFTRRLLDDQPVDLPEVRDFAAMVGETMRETTERLVLGRVPGVGTDGQGTRPASDAEVEAPSPSVPASTPAPGTS